MNRYHGASSTATAVTHLEDVQKDAEVKWDDVASCYTWATAPSKGIQKRTFKPLKGNGIVSLSDYEISQLPNAARKCVNAMYSMEVIRNGKVVTYERAYCKSWKCPVCASYSRAVTYCQIRDTLKQIDASTIFYAVNTVSSVVLTNVHDVNADESYGYVYKCFKRMKQRIRRHYSDIKFIQTVERQGNKYAHLNTIWVSKKLAADWIASPLMVASWYNKISTESGFGHMTSFSPVQNVEGMASYITKISNKGDDGTTVNQASHITKLTQLPLNTPKHFRRIRATPKFLVRRFTGMSTDNEVEYRFIRGHAELLNVMKASQARHDETYAALPPDADGSVNEQSISNKNDSDPVDISPTPEHTVSYGGDNLELPLVVSGITDSPNEASGTDATSTSDDARGALSRWELVKVYDGPIHEASDGKELDELSECVVISLAEYRRTHA